MYSSHFMSQLPRGNTYGFESVQNYSRPVEGKLLELEELCIPINANKNHWKFIRVTLQQKKIKFWDSLGPGNTSNREYLKTVE